MPLSSIRLGFVYPQFREGLSPQPMKNANHIRFGSLLDGEKPIPLEPPSLVADVIKALSNLKDPRSTLQFLDEQNKPKGFVSFYGTPDMLMLATYRYYDEKKAALYYINNDAMLENVTYFNNQDPADEIKKQEAESLLKEILSALAQPGKTRVIIPGRAH